MTKGGTTTQVVNVTLSQRPTMTPSPPADISYTRQRRRRVAVATLTATDVDGLTDGTYFSGDGRGHPGHSRH